MTVRARPLAAVTVSAGLGGGRDPGAQHDRGAEADGQDGRPRADQGRTGETGRDALRHGDLTGRDGDRKPTRRTDTRRMDHPLVTRTPTDPQTSRSTMKGRT